MAIKINLDQAMTLADIFIDGVNNEIEIDHRFNKEGGVTVFARPVLLVDESCYGQDWQRVGEDDNS